MKFIGREYEIQKLEELYGSDGFQMPVIYGRRRVGKSTLIQHFVKERKSILFTAIESSPEKNLEQFSKCVYHTLLPQIKNLPSFQDFDAAFAFITSYVKKERLIVVIDEYPYLAGSDRSISSLLQRYIDEQWKESRMFLILCGSSMSFMENQVLGYESPLYGRRTAQFKILPFDYQTSALFVPEYTPEEKAVVYGVTGGIPKYLEQFHTDKSVSENIKNLFFDSTGYLYEEPANLLKQELRDLGKYNAVIEALAHGAVKVNELSGKTHMDSESVIYCLKTLMSLDIVIKETAVTEEKNKKKTAYRLGDNMFRFWYRFVQDAIPMIELRQGAAYYDEVVIPQMSDYMGGIFEEMCRYYMISRQIHKDFPLISIGRWWGTNPYEHREEEIDIVGFNPVRKMAVTGECKYRNEKLNVKIAESLVSKSNLLGGCQVMGYYLFAKAGFTEETCEWAKDHNMSMITLEEMYE